MIEKRREIDFLTYRYRFLLNYIFIGFGSIVLEIIVAKSINYFFSLNILFASIFGFILGATFSFILNTKLNFQVPKDKNIRTFKVFFTISIISYSISFILFYIINKFYSYDYAVLRLIIAGIVFVVSYTLHRRYTFINIKYVGVALYLTDGGNFLEVWDKIENYPDFIHLDIVDETYNSKLKRQKIDFTYGKKIKSQWLGIPVMTHIMSKYPSKWINKVSEFSDIIIVHYEIDEDINQIFQSIKLSGKKVGISILFSTDIENILPYLSEVNTVQVLGIFQPGESGQHLEKAALAKLAELNSIKEQYKFNICFDGGVKRENIGSIEADYVVSASSILNADNPVNAIFDLKTSSRYYSQMSSLKEFLKKKILGIGQQTSSILSLNIVGSFSDQDEISGISDVDIVIIIDELTKNSYQEILEQFDKLKEEIETDYSLKVKINNSFGPLKFDDIADVVLHVMVYDLKGHLDHCLMSPFTVLDWERSQLFAKKQLKNVISTFIPQPNQLLNSRRGIETYLDDLNKGVITYRKYETTINKNKIGQITLKKSMKDKDRVEYVYHIMKFMILNFMKIYYSNNVSFSDQLVEEFFNLTNIDYDYHFFFREMRRRKTKKKNKITKNEIITLKQFLSELKKAHNRIFFDSSKSIIFVRHAKTSLNKKGVFLGQKNDPPIQIDVFKERIEKLQSIVEKSQKLYTSPLRRALETAYLINQKSKLEITINHCINEIDYGDLDGMSYDYLTQNFPEIISGWEKKEDIAFPGGEKYSDITERLDSFIHIINKIEETKIVVVTHNVIMRSIIGKILRIPYWHWYKIEIDNLEDFEVLLLKNGTLYLNLELDKISKIYQKIYDI